MNLSPLLETMVAQLKQQRTAEAQLAAQAVELKVGRVLAAVVTESTPLTEAERQQALDKLHQQLVASHARTQTNLTAAKTGAQELINEIRHQLQDWIRQPQLYLIGLRAGRQEMFTVSPQALAAQQLVKVMVRADGQLQLLNKTLDTPVSLAPRPTANAPVTAGAPALPKTVARPAAEPLHMLAASLRQSLPAQSSVAGVLRVLARVEAELTALPLPARQQLLPPETLKALARILAHSHTPAELSQPDVLRQALKHSGVLFENRLASALRPASAAIPAAAQAAISGQPVAQRLQVTSVPPVSKAVPGTVAPDKAPPTPETDLKAALLQALHHLRAPLPAAHSPAVTPRAATGTDTLLAALLGLVQTTPTKPKTSSEMRQQLIQSLHQQVSGALAKIQTQQLQSLSHRLGDASAPAQGGHFELPVRLGDGFSTVSLHIQEYWQRDQGAEQSPGDKRRDAEKVPQWEVFMEFDLEEDGQLTAQVKVLNGSVSANFWAEKESIRLVATARLAELRAQMEASGVEVKDMQCLPGLPPRKDLKLNYNLVDVRT